MTYRFVVCITGERPLPVNLGLQALAHHGVVMWEGVKEITPRLYTMGEVLIFSVHCKGSVENE